jgi:hypothetical protein
MSFLLDPPLLVGAGAAIERLELDEDTTRRLHRGVLALFIGGSLALYANAPGLRPLWGPFGSRSGREFMITSGLAHIDEDGIPPRRHLVALALFLAYPLWLKLGRVLGAHRSGERARAPEQPAAPGG